MIDVDAIHRARETFRRHIAAALKDELLAVYNANKTDGAYIPNALDSGKRAVKNTALTDLSLLDDTLAQKQYREPAQITNKEAVPN